jgi:hypothetical protein
VRILFYSASTIVCVPTSLAQETALALGAQAGQAKLTETEDRFHAVLHAGKYRLRSLLLRLNAASDGIENGIPSLLDRRDRIVDRDARFPFQFIGVILRALGA